MAGPPIICIYFAPNYTETSAGGPVDFRPGDPALAGWVNMRNDNIVLPWGSFVNDSGSSVVFGNASTNTTHCLPAHYENPNPTSVIHFAYLHVEFGVTNCTGTIPGLS